MEYKILGEQFFHHFEEMVLLSSCNIKSMFILSVDFWLVSYIKVNPVPVTTYCLKADIFQQMHLTTNEKTNPIWVLRWQNRN